MAKRIALYRSLKAAKKDAIRLATSELIPCAVWQYEGSVADGSAVYAVGKMCYQSGRGMFVVGLPDERIVWDTRA